MFKRIFLIVCDSLGVGELEDAKKYNDQGSNTLGHIIESYEKANITLNIPTLNKLGFSNIMDENSTNIPMAYYQKLKEISAGKDTLTGHFEMMGVKVEKPYITFTKFPDELIKKIEELSGRKVISNEVASGTEIINRLGEEHMKNKGLIVYTSSDSVLQIAAHEEVIPLEELYDICAKVRELTMREDWMVARIIARPFLGDKKGNFYRTPNRHDYALNPPAKTELDVLKENGYDVISIGKIVDIFNKNGITEYYKSKSSIHGMEQTMDMLNKDFKGLCFTNLVDFDSSYGHRRDPIGYGHLLMEFDRVMEDFTQKMRDDDLLIITADHGNDPTFNGTDHTREYVPLIMHFKNCKGKKLSDNSTFANIGKTILDNFKIKNDFIGVSYLDELK